MLREELHLVLGDSDASPVHGVFTETEFVAVQHDIILANQCEVIWDLFEGPCKVLGIQRCIVNHPLDVFDAHNDLVVPVGVGVPTGSIALWGTCVPVPAPHSTECCKVSVLLCNCDTMIAIPGIQHQLLGVVGHVHGLLQGWLGGVTLPHTDLVQFLHVHSVPGVPIEFSADHHAVAPGDGCVLWHLLQHAQGTITVQVLLNFGLSLDWDRCRGEHLVGPGILVNEQLHR